MHIDVRTEVYQLVSTLSRVADVLNFQLIVGETTLKHRHVLCALVKLTFINNAL